MKKEYYITDGKRFVKQNIKNQYSTVGNCTIADCWNTYQVAKAVLDNSVPKAWRSTFYVAEMNEGKLIKTSLTQDEKEAIKAEVVGNTETPSSYELKLRSNKRDYYVDSVITAFEIVEDCLKDVEQKLREQQSRQQFLNYAFEDVKHHHLLENLGTVKAYKRDSLESEILGERLLVNNNIEVYQKINKHKQTISEAIKDICHTFKLIESKKYTPRVLPELFEDGMEFVTPELLDKIATNGRITKRV